MLTAATARTKAAKQRCARAGTAAFYPSATVNGFRSAEEIVAVPKSRLDVYYAY